MIQFKDKCSLHTKYPNNAVIQHSTAFTKNVALTDPISCIISINIDNCNEFVAIDELKSIIFKINLAYDDSNRKLITPTNTSTDMTIF